MQYRILTFFAFCAVCLAQCTQDMVRGTWAAYYLGTIMVTPADGSDPVATSAAQLLVETVDYQGNFTGKGYASIGGQLMTGTFTGNIQVNPDCTASDTFTVSVAGMGQLPGTGSERLVVLNNGNEMRAMATKGLLGNPAGIGYYRRISWSDPQCTQDMVHGMYVTTWDGAWIAPGQSAGVPYSQIGVGSFAYNGKMGFVGTMSVGPHMIRTGGGGQLTVNSDCTGSTALANGGVNQFVVLSNGDELLQIAMQQPPGSGQVATIGQSRRISMVPAAPNW